MVSSEGLGDAIHITLSLAAVTTVLLLLIATPLAWWLARGHSVFKDVVTAITTLPIVLPPTVLGFYLLVAMGPNSPLMVLFEPLGIRTLNFTFTGLVIGSVFYSLPFAVQPIRNAFAAIDPKQLDVASSLSASRLRTFFEVVVPQSRRGFVTAALLVFAHTIGEFGVVLMIGGSIPGKTEVISIRIYQLVEQLRWGEAHQLAAGLAVFAFAIIMTLLWMDRHKAKN